MKKLYTSIIILVTLLFNISSLYAQGCKNKTVYLDQHFTYIVTREDVLAAPLGSEYEVTFNPKVLTCEHTGDTRISVTIKLNGNVVTTCFANFLVLETQRPNAVCKSTVHVQLNEYGEHYMTAMEVDNGSFDNCSDLEYYFIPDGVSCSSPNPSTISMYVRDRSGNERSCSVQVFWEDPNPSPPLTCQGDLYIFFDDDDGEEWIYVEMITLDFDIDCQENYDLEVLENGIPRPQPIVTIDDTNALLQVSVVNTYTGESCIVDLNIIVCDPNTFISFCDTLCRTAPLGDCGSGHSLDDGVEWPCDIFLGQACIDSSLYPTPEILRDYYQIDLRDASPQFKIEGCTKNALFEGYWDLVDNTAPNPSIIRTWTVFNWLTQEYAEFKQTIYLQYDTTYICDQLPWDAPVGDCGSGHSFDDDVEWPADIIVHTTFVHPDDLATNPNVLFQNAKPQLELNCNKAAITYSDLVTEINDTTAIIERTWTIIDFYTNHIWEYVQHITVIGNHTAALVCVNLETGQAIPDVQLVAGVETDQSGCYSFDNPAGITVEPQKTSTLAEGVNLLDLVLLDKYLLGIAALSEYQTYSADLNTDDTITTSDAIAMKKLLNGTLTTFYPTHWQFSEQHTKAPTADISNPLPAHRFIGAKLGDVNNDVLEGDIDYPEVIIRIDDHQMLAGEVYHLPVHMDLTKLIEGFAIKFITNDPSLEFLAVSSTQLTALSLDDYFVSENEVTILWTAPAQGIAEGVNVTQNAPLFFLVLRAKEELILSEKITFENEFDHLVKGKLADDIYDLTLQWEGIINTTIDLTDGRQLTIYPIPTSDILFIDGFKSDDKGTIRVVDPMGVIVATFEIHESINLSPLPQGIYYLQIQLDSVTGGVIPLVKISE